MFASRLAWPVVDDIRDFRNRRRRYYGSLAFSLGARPQRAILIERSNALIRRDILRIAEIETT